MPLYEYRCSECSRVFEAYKRLSDEKSEETCPACGGTSVKLGISAFSAGTTGKGSRAGASSCGIGFRRSPFR